MGLSAGGLGQSDARACGSAEGARAIVTTTPRPIPLLRRLRRRARHDRRRGGRTEENEHLPDDFMADVRARYGGTRLGRQELDGELIEEIEGALWTRALVEEARGTAPDDFVRVVIGVDPPASAAGDECGIVVCGLERDGTGWVLADASAGGLSPEGWARRGGAGGRGLVGRQGDRRDQPGRRDGDRVLRGADCALPVKPVTARFGKGKRAEPVAQRFETGKAKFAGAFPELEDQLCGLTAGGAYEGPGRSPDRADAMVWAMAELLLGVRREPSVRRL